VICLDVLRAMAREPDSIAALIGEIETARGADARLDAWTADLKDMLAAPHGEADARLLVERMAIALQASLLVRHSPHAVADAFCATRLADRPGFVYGALDAKVDEDAIIARATPQI
jgi:putative acyl-CoA dehydrogenase